MSVVPANWAPLPAGRRSPLLRGVRRAVLQDFEAELALCERVAVLLGAGFKRTEIVRMLATTPGKVKAAEYRLRRAVEILDQGE
jgi:hypothetical protein